tara:strand:+ start:251 stop:2545 length:2295 start_codon:yes stop_codon:yes gene_type:complete
MARIQNQTVYPLKTPISLADYVIGTDSVNSLITKNFLIGDLIDLVDGTALQDGILSGAITWISGLTFEVSDLVVVINGSVYSLDGTTITLDAADVTNPRIDLIIVDLSLVQPIVKSTGTAAVTPAANFLSDSTTQLQLTFINIAAGATTPTGVSADLVYDEDAGSPGEWDGVVTETNIGTIDLASTAQANTGTKSISVNGSTLTDGDKITLTSDGTHAVADISTIHLYIYLTASTTSPANWIDVTLYNGATLVSDNVRIINGYNGFDTSVTGIWQSVIIPISDFKFSTISATSITVMVLTFEGALSTLFYLDTINLISGVNNPPTTNTFLGLSDVNDTTYAGKAGYVATVSDDMIGMVLSPNVSATGFEAISEGGNNGFRLIGQDAANHGNIGNSSVSAIVSTLASSVIGVTGNNSFGIGNNSEMPFNDSIMVAQVDNDLTGVTNTFSSGNFIAGAIHIFGNNIYQSYINGQDNQIGTPAATLGTASYFSNVMSGRENVHLNGVYAGTVGGALINNGAYSFVVGIANIDPANTTATNNTNSWLGTTGQDRFTVGVGNWNIAAMTGTRRNGLRVEGDGKIWLETGYGDGTHTGTAAYHLGITAAGQITAEALSAGFVTLDTTQTITALKTFNPASGNAITAQKTVFITTTVGNALVVNGASGGHVFEVANTSTTGITLRVNSTTTNGATGAGINVNMSHADGVALHITAGTVQFATYTVATLPTGVEGDMAYVTDATAPTYLGALTGGGAVSCPVYKNATIWVSN